MTDQSTPPRPPRGGAPLGHLAELDPVSSAAVLYLRLWCEGQKAHIARDFDLALGADHGAGSFAAFCDLCRLCLDYGRRPLRRHHLSCACFGSDEACFAQLITSAGEGAREDALMLGMLLVRPDIAPMLVAQAASVGLALQRMMLRQRRNTCTLH